MRGSGWASWGQCVRREVCLVTRHRSGGVQGSPGDGSRFRDLRQPKGSPVE